MNIHIKAEASQWLNVECVGGLSSLWSRRQREGSFSPRVASFQPVSVINIKILMSNRKERKPLPYNSNHYLNMREQGSPTKASVLLQEDHAEYI